MQTQAADLEADIWGIALLNLQADLPDESGDNLTLVVFGDAEISSAVTDDADLEFTAPLQAITLRSGASDSCEQAPDGLLIRSPEGQRTRLIVNGVELTLSSATYITADANATMTIEGLEGEIDVTAQGQTETVAPSFLSTVTLDENFEPASPPTAPEPVDPSIAFPFDVFSTIFGDTDAATSPSTGSSASLTNFYSGASYAFHYPADWLVQEILGSSTNTLAISNAESLNFDLVNFPSNTTVVLIGTLADFAASMPETIAGSSPDAILNSYARQPLLLITAGPEIVEIGPHSVTRLQLGSANNTVNLIFYGFENLLLTEYVSPDSTTDLDSIVQDIIASLTFDG